MHNGSRAFCLLMALAATGSEAASAATTLEHYHVEAKLVSLPAGDVKDFSAPGFYNDSQIGKFAANPKVSCLAFPRVEAAETFPSTIAITKAFHLPDGTKRETGITLKISPDSKNPDAHSFNIQFENVRFMGFTDRKAAQPVFNTQRLTTTVSPGAQNPTPGYYGFILPASAKTPETYDANGRRSASVADANERQLLFVKITRG